MGVEERALGMAVGEEGKKAVPLGPGSRSKQKSRRSSRTQNWNGIAKGVSDALGDRGVTQGNVKTMVRQAYKIRYSRQ